MKKITTISVMALLCLNFNAPAQQQLSNKECVVEATTSYKWGFSEYMRGHKQMVKLSDVGFNKWRRLMVYNHSLSELYAIALGAGTPFINERVIIDVREPLKLKSIYCYELQAPPEFVDNMYTIMHQNLLYQFPDYVAVIRQRNGESYLVIEDKDEGILSKGAKKVNGGTSMVNNTY